MSRRTDPDDPRAFIDIFTDIDPLFVINNESGWYEGWMIHDLTVPNTAPARSDGTGAATFGTITTADADALKLMGTGNNVPGEYLHDGWPDVEVELDEADALDASGDRNRGLTGGDPIGDDRCRAQP